MKTIFFFVLALMLSSDGLVAVCYKYRKQREKRIERETTWMLQHAKAMDWTEELSHLAKAGKANIPEAVKRRRGYTTRGNQLIARAAWAPLIEDINKRIERIIR